MLDLGALINVMPKSIYKALNFGDLEPTGMTIQLANISVVQPLGVLEDVLVQVNELIFPANFYVLDMEDKTSGQGSTLILGRPFLITAKTKIDVHVGTLSMESGDILVQFNIFEAMKHPTEDHSLFGIDLIDELVEEYFQIDSHSEDIDNFAKITDSIDCLGSISEEEADYGESGEVDNLSDSVENSNDISDLDFEAELLEVLDQVCKHENPEYSIEAEVQVAETKLLSTQLATIFTAEYESAKGSRDQERTEVISAKKTTVKADWHSLPKHLKYVYLDTQQQLPVIIANNLHEEQEDKLLQHKKAIGWKLSNLPRINPSICMHRILLEEVAKPIRQQQRRMNSTILDVVKKEVTKLLAAGIIYPISDSQWVSPVQVVPKKSGMTVMKNQQATRKDHFPLPFIDQVLEKLSGKSHYCFLDGFSSYMQIHIAPEDQYKTTFTCPFGTFVYTRMPFGMCNAPSTFQHCMTTIFSDLLQDCREVFMDNFTVYAKSSTDPLYTFDPEIELTLRRLRKIRNTTVDISNSLDPVINSDQSCTDHSVASTNIFSEPGQMENHDRTLKELATPDVVYQPWCIQYPQLEPAQTYELKSGLINLLPKFHGLVGEDPHKYLKEFHVVCSTMRP
ncbi:hypothetical protein CR513_23502, partial [Mucuna pruriens]